MEWALGLVVLYGGLYVAWVTVSQGYFPAPFFYDADDTWRDWFSTAIWAHDPGAYDTWLSIYPPISFVFLKYASLPSCYEFAPMGTVRDCDWVGVGVFHFIYVVNIVLTAAVMMKIDRKTALPRAFTLCAGMPMLFGLERANLVLLVYTLVVLAYGPLIKSARMRWLLIGMAVNFKVYLIAGVIPHLLKRRWLHVEGCLIATAAVWLVTYAIYGAGTPLEVFQNITNWAGGATPDQMYDFWYTNTYLALRYVVGESPAPVNMYLDSDQANALMFFMVGSARLAQLLILLAALAAWLRPEVVSPHRLTFLGLALAMATTETSPYTQPLLFFFVFFERWTGVLRPLAIASVYIVSIPGDIILSSANPVIQFSFIANRYVTTIQALGLTMFFRPFLFLLPAYFLAAHTIVAVIRDVREDGWKGRWRFRHDAPLLPNVRRPVGPLARDANGAGAG